MPYTTKIIPEEIVIDFNISEESLKGHLDKYNSWIFEGKVPSSSKVIPIHEETKYFGGMMRCSMIIVAGNLL
jgi:hypothetical protein